MTKLFQFTKPPRKLVAVKQWKPGDAFARVTGMPIDKAMSIKDIDDAVKRARHIRGDIPFDDGTSKGFVVRSGDVFPHSTDDEKSISNKIDEALKLKA
jgi:hypothetical protein